MIAYDHRGHGRSGLPTRRANYGLNFLAADLDFIYDLFAATPPAGRGGWARTLVHGLGSQKHISLQNLTVPTLVIGSEKDRLLPMVSSRRIARMAPNLAEFVELSGGHCAILERPNEVNRRLRWLIESVTEPERATS